jgi:16S rRNA (cytidine1402-2'-O)-methyltransferase
MDGGNAGRSSGAACSGGGPPPGSGVLSVVGTPIGNLKDITLRALDVLRDSDLILCEDTRVTRKLLEHYGVRKPLRSFFVGNEGARTGEALEALLSGARVAIVTDAGTPGVSDPGYLLVRACRERGIPVTPVPGPSALATALSASGLPSQRVLFLGFPPRRSGERSRLLESLVRDPSTLVFYEAPHRIRAFLGEARGILAGRECVVCREMTKLFEEFSMVSDAGEVQERGEFVVVFGPPGEPAAEAVSLDSVGAEVRALVDSGVEEKEALRRVARSKGVSRREIYSILKVRQGEPERKGPRVRS